MKGAKTFTTSIRILPFLLHFLKMINVHCSYILPGILNFLSFPHCYSSKLLCKMLFNYCVFFFGLIFCARSSKVISRYNTTESNFTAEVSILWHNKHGHCKLSLLSRWSYSKIVVNNSTIYIPRSIRRGILNKITFLNYLSSFNLNGWLYVSRL